MAHSGPILRPRRSRRSQVTRAAHLGDRVVAELHQVDVIDHQGGVRPESGCADRVANLSLCEPLTQALRPYIGPVVFDEGQTGGAVRGPVNRAPTCWDIGEGRPQAVLFLVIHQNEEAAIVIIKRIDTHQFS